MKVVYEDNHLVVVIKPAGVPSQPDRSRDPSALDWVKGYIKRRYDKPGEAFAGLVHRLDRPVSGVMVFARTSKAASRLFAQFRDRKVDKTYLAVVEGDPPGPEGRAVHHLRKDSRTHTAQVVAAGAPGALEARLVYRLVHREAGNSLLEVRLETGRHHQIRAQLAALGTPVVGDSRYGSGRSLEGRVIALHAVRLGLTHPVRREPMEFYAPPPGVWPWDSFDLSGPTG